MLDESGSLPSAITNQLSFLRSSWGGLLVLIPVFPKSSVAMAGAEMTAELRFDIVGSEGSAETRRSSGEYSLGIIKLSWWLRKSV